MMWNHILNAFSRPDVIIGMLTDVGIDVWSCVLFGVPDTGVDVLTNVNANFSTVMIIAVTSPWEEFCFFSLMAVLKWARNLQALTPSCHVCSSLEFPALTQLPNQDPPRAQQLILPDFKMVPHSEHKEVMLVVATADGMRGMINMTRQE